MALTSLARLGGAFKPLQEASDKLGDSKTQKGMGAFGKMIKGVKGASSPAVMFAEAFSRVFVFLEPIAAVFDILGGLFEIMGANIIPMLMTALAPVFSLLIALTPVFELLGKVIGLVMQLALIPITVLFKILGAVLIPLMPLLQPLIDFLDKLSPVIETITDIIVDAILSIEFWVGVGKGIFEGFKKVIGGIVGGIVKLINSIIKGINAVLGWAGVDIDTIKLAKGGIAVKPTLAMIGEGGESEAVVPLSKSKEMGFGGGSVEILHEMEKQTTIAQDSNLRLRKLENNMKLGRKY